jgi:hypothetical protein
MAVGARVWDRVRSWGLALVSSGVERDGYNLGWLDGCNGADRCIILARGYM